MGNSTNENNFTEQSVFTGKFYFLLCSFEILLNCDLFLRITASDNDEHKIQEDNVTEVNEKLNSNHLEDAEMAIEARVEGN